MMKNSAFLLFVKLTIILLIIGGCAKKRAVDLDDSTKRETREVNLYQNKTMQITLDGSNDEKNNERIIKRKVIKIEGSEHLHELVNNLYLDGLAHEKIWIKTVLTSNKRLNVYKVIPKERYQQLTELEKTIAIYSRSKNVYFIKLYHYDVRSLGYLEQIKDDRGDLTSRLQLVETPLRQATHFIAPFMDDNRSFVKTRGEYKEFSSEKILQVNNFKDKKFLFRRTLVDLPNTTPLLGGISGSASPIEIVEFDFDDDDLIIKRSYPLQEVRGHGDNDKEPLIKLRAKYYKKSYYDKSGNELDLPEYLPADQGEEDVFALVDWGDNQVPAFTSPFHYYALSICFSPAGEYEVSRMDNRMDSDGIMNFTLKRDYAGNYGTDCTGMWEESLMNKRQKTFRFEERISFKVYNDSIKNNEPLWAIPYDAQKKLGYGVFTRGKEKPGYFGISGTIGNTVSIPNIFDFRDKSKSYTYILSGLPLLSGSDFDKQIRQAVIESTIEVIKDANQLFYDSFKGTSMERKRHQIFFNLEIEGLTLDEEKKYNIKRADYRSFGDLDRNYIHYVNKVTEQRGLLGLGGASTNPLSGKVEAGLLTMYGSNIFAVMEIYEKLSRIDSEYYKNLNPGNWKFSKKDKNATLTEGKKEEASISNELLSFVSESRVSVPLMAKEKSKVAFFKIFSDERKNLALFDNYQEEININELMRKIVQKQLFNNKHDLMIAFYENSDEEKIYKYKKDLEDKLHLNNFCMKVDSLVDTLSEADLSYLENKEYKEFVPDMQVFKKMYIKTLAHELGHNFGLRHNFHGSYDVENWNFKDEKKKTRSYSTVMDYEHYSESGNYAGYGPQDRHAIRAAYAGMIERNNTLASIEDLLKESGEKYWENISGRSLLKLGVKSYKFCADEDLGLDATCNQSDKGFTALQIVDFYINDFYAKYPLYFFPGDRERFGIYSARYNLLYKLFHTFGKISGFLDNFYLELLRIKSYPDNDPLREKKTRDLNDVYEAAKESYKFFLNVVRTPDTPDFLEIHPDNRFIKTVTEDETGKEIIQMYESKWFDDVVIDPEDSNRNKRTQVLGYKWAKIVAFWMLMKRSEKLGIDHGKENYTISYIAFEDTFLKKNVQEKLSQDIVEPSVIFTKTNIQALLVELMRDGIRPGILDFFGYKTLENVAQAQTNSMLRMGAIVSSVYELRIAGKFQDDPYLRFLVGSKTGSAPSTEDNFFINHLAWPDTHYFALKNGFASDLLIRDVAVYKYLIENKKEVLKTMERSLQAYLLVRSKDETLKEKLVKKHFPEGNISSTEVLNQFRKEADSNLQKILDHIQETKNVSKRTIPIEFSDYLKKFVSSINSVLEKDDKEREYYKYLLMNKIMILAKNQPLYIFALNSIDLTDYGATPEAAKLANIITSEAISFMDMYLEKMFNSVEILSELTSWVHPVLNRK